MVSPSMILTTLSVNSAGASSAGGSHGSAGARPGARHDPLGVQNSQRRRSAMTLCPIAIVASCKKCPAFSVCPLKTVIGDYMQEKKEQTKQQGDSEEK